MSIKRDLKMYRILLLLAIFVAFFSTLGFVPLFDLDEGAFSEATREMLFRGDYLTTYLNGDLRFDKPILIYWLQALCVKIFGLNEFSVRLPSALASTLWALAIFYFTKRFTDEKRAFVATFAMVVGLQITIIAKAAIADALLNLFIALSMFCIYLYYEKKAMKYLYGTFVFMALGTLTKGPVAVMIPFVVSFLFYLYKGELKAWLKAVFNPLGVFIFVAIALPWYLMEYLEQGQKFIDGFFLKHNFDRFHSPMEGHYGSLFYYIPVFLIGLLPFTPLFLKSISNFREIFKDDLKLFLMIWFVFVFVFFSFSGTKLPHYIIYGYTPLFILLGIDFDRFSLKRVSLAPLFLYILLIALPIVLKIEGVGIIKDEFARIVVGESMELFDLRYFLVLLVAVLLSLYLFVAHIKPLYKFVVTGFVFVLVINMTVLPLVANAQQLPIKEAALVAKSKNLDVVFYHINTPSFSFYERKITHKRDIKNGDFVLTKANRLESIKKYDTIYHKRGVFLIKVIEK
ncbi:MAG: glycosyltransferase family 39 protein [Sulfurospirillum sp.]|nr:MAG: glycosyltransferase family 39 protein [Sulfurospirillum sp.]